MHGVCVTGNISEEQRAQLYSGLVPNSAPTPAASTDPLADRMLLILIMSTIAASCGVACLIILISFL